MVNIPECTASYTHPKMAAKSVADFMEEVQRYDCLYNKFLRHYKKECMKAHWWIAIGEKRFSKSAEDAERNH